jgi:hypothetical protein
VFHDHDAIAAISMGHIRWYRVDKFHTIYIAAPGPLQMEAYRISVYVALNIRKALFGRRMLARSPKSRPNSTRCYNDQKSKRRP